MDTYIKAQLDRVEGALNTLIDSITSYNPSTAGATDILAADNELSDGLQLRVCQHQHNYTRIVALRNEAERLDSRIVSTVCLLAETRKELLDTPATAFSEKQRNVPVDELLSYAKHISKFTVPPTRRQPRPPELSTTKPESQTQDGDVEKANGVADPRDPSQDIGKEVSKDNGLGVTSLQQTEVDWLDPAMQIPWVPWPSEDVIRRGALAQIQAMVEQGVDPGKGPVAEDEAEDVKMQDVEGETVKETAPARVDPSRKQSEIASAREEKPKVFGGLDLYDPDEED